MYNFVTNREYTGKNVDILMASGKGEESLGFIKVRNSLVLRELTLKV